MAIQNVSYTRYQLASLLLLPDRKDIFTLFLCFPVVNFIQVDLFEQEFTNYWQSLSDFYFFPILGVCYISYWGLRYGYTSIFQMMAHEERRRQKGKDGDIDLKFFGLWFSLLLFVINGIL